MDGDGPEEGAAEEPGGDGDGVVPEFGGKPSWNVDLQTIS